jgi:hypothetical protein
MSMAERPSPPYVYLGMYFREPDSQRSLRAAAEYLMKRDPNACFREVQTISPEWHSGGPYRWSEIGYCRFYLACFQTLKQVEHATSDRIVALYIDHSESLVPGVVEVVEEETISDEAIDHNPIAIRMNGEGFSGPPGEPLGDTVQLGAALYRRARGLAEALNPVYLSIYVETTLMCPHDLRTKGGGVGSDVFLSREEFGEEPLRLLCRECTGAFIETWNNGIYISASADMNPRHQELAHGEGSALFDCVGRFIAENYRP